MVRVRHWLGVGMGLAAAISAYGQRAASEAAYELLAREAVFVHQAMASRVNVPELRSAAAAASPMTVKILVVPSLRGRWVANGRENRGSYAKWLLTERLSLKNASVIVATDRGITGYSDRVSASTLATLSNGAISRGTSANLTPAIVWLVGAIKDEAGRPTALPLATSAASAGSSRLWSTVLILFGVAGVAALIIWAAVAGNRAKKLALARAMAKELRGQVVDGIGYLDNYADLLPAGENADAVRQYRQAAEAKYMQAAKQIDAAKQPQEIDQAKLYLSQALQDIERGKQHIEAATDGSKVAYTIGNASKDSLPGPNGALAEDAQVYQPVPNTCFFCSYPGKGDLTPVTLTIDGQKRTVLACPNDLSALRSGSPPPIRAMQVDGRHVPWYRVPGYDPVVSYNDRSFAWDMLSMVAISSLFNPFSFGYHGYGGWGAAPYADSYATHNGVQPDAQQGDWGTADQGLADLDTSGDFVGSEAGDFGSDFGGGDFGGGDFGGGDF